MSFVSKINISVAICTHNRDKHLGKALDSLVLQTLPVREFEIIVIDNKSTDRTKEIVLQYYKHVENLRYIYEPILGLSQAKNTAWKNAKGTYVAYLDDDAIAAPNWLEQILITFEEYKSKGHHIGALGGKVEPIWEIPKPHWLTDQMALQLTVLDWSDVPIFIENESKWIVGANTIYPKTILEKFGGFSIQLGRKGKKLLSHEENLLHHQIREAGNKIVYDPIVKVKHLIPKERINQEWLLNRRYWGGFSSAMVHKLRSNDSLSQHVQLFFNHFNKYLRLRLSKGNSFDKKLKIKNELGWIFGLIKG